MAAPLAAKAAIAAASSKTGQRIILLVVAMAAMIVMAPTVLFFGAASAFPAPEPPKAEASAPSVIEGGDIKVSGDWTHPLGGGGAWVSCEYLCYPGHFGIDLAVGQGTPVYAASSGTVSAAMYFGDWDYGWGVYIEHGGGVHTRYAHFVSKPVVSSGQKVKAGQLIGHVGSTGNSTGPHLHFETRQNGVGLNPRDFLRPYGVQF